MTDASEIPTIDLDDLKSSDPGRLARAAADLLTGFGTYGLVYVRNHGVDPGVVGQLYDDFVGLTDRSPEEKEQLSGDRIWFQRGWTPANTERAVVAGGQPDFKECYFAAPVDTDRECHIQYPQIYAQNIWPPDMPDYQARYLESGQALHDVGLWLLRGAARALELEVETFAGAATGGPHVFRLLRYLPLSAQQVNSDIVWGEEHTDFNLITVLPGGRFHDPDGARCERPDDASGLYLRTRPSAEHPRGRKVRGQAPSGCIVAQVGQQLEILTGGEFLATPHVITAPATPGYTRVSGAHFVHLHSHQTVFPLPRFRNAETLRAYSPPVLAGTYSIKTLVDIGLAPPAALQRLGYRHYDRLADARAHEAGAN